MSQNKVPPYWAMNFQWKPSAEERAGAQKFIEDAAEQWIAARKAFGIDSAIIDLFKKV